MRLFVLRLSLLTLIVMGSLVFGRSVPVMAEEPAATEPITLPAACALNGVEPTEPDHWMAVWNFDTPQGCILYTGAQPDPLEPPPIVGYDLIECANVGNVQFGEGYAYFDGRSYLRCTLAVDPANPAEEYANYDSFWMYAQVAPTLIQSPNPIFHHPSARFSAPIQGTVLMSRLTWSFQHSTNTFSTGSTSGHFASYNDHLRIASCHELSKWCSDYPGTTYAQIPRINGVDQPLHPASAAVRFQKTAPIYIGYTPGTRNYFNGLMGMLVIDPPGYGKDPTPDALPDPATQQ